MIALRTRSLLSRTVASGSPTIVNFGSPPVMWTSTCTGGAVIPRLARLKTDASDIARSPPGRRPSMRDRPCAAEGGMCPVPCRSRAQRTQEDGWPRALHRDSPLISRNQHETADRDLLVPDGGRRIAFGFERTGASSMTRSMHSALLELRLHWQFTVQPGHSRFRFHERVLAIGSTPGYWIHNTPICQLPMYQRVTCKSPAHEIGPGSEPLH